VAYLRGEIDEKALLDKAADDDQRATARCYLGLDQLLKGQVEDARKNLLWAKEHGTPTIFPVEIAAAELDRLDAKPSAAGP
jgi:hypothetical protein